MEDPDNVLRPVVPSWIADLTQDDEIDRIQRELRKVGEKLSRLQMERKRLDEELMRRCDAKFKRA